MAKKKVTAVAEELLADFLAAEGYELYHIEFVKEGGDWFLRVYIDLPPDENGEDRYVSTEDCEKVSRFLSEALDQADPVQQNYYLEVSSPGLDRPLLKPEHYRRYVGRPIEVRLYRGKDGTKNIEGILESFDDGAAKAGVSRAEADAEPDADVKGDPEDGTSEADRKNTAKEASPMVVLTDEAGKRWELALEEIAKARLAVII